MIEQEIVATPWGDEQRMRDASVVEVAAADKLPEGVSTAEVADLDYAGDARAAALDLSLADGRWAPAVLEASARRAVAAWAEAVDGADRDLLDVATPEAASALLHPGDPSGKTRLVIRGPRVQRLRIVALDPAATPPTMTVEVEVRGRRYVEDRDDAVGAVGLEVARERPSPSAGRSRSPARTTAPGRSSRRRRLRRARLSGAVPYPRSMERVWASRLRWRLRGAWLAPLLVRAHARRRAADPLAPARRRRADRTSSLRCCWRASSTSSRSRRSRRSSGWRGGGCGRTCRSSSRATARASCSCCS